MLPSNETSTVKIDWLAIQRQVAANLIASQKDMFPEGTR